jgi:hypothetical protein
MSGEHSTDADARPYQWSLMCHQSDEAETLGQAERSGPDRAAPMGWTGRSLTAPTSPDAIENLPGVVQMRKLQIAIQGPLHLDDGLEAVSSS